MTYKEYMEYTANKELDAKSAFMKKQNKDSGTGVFTKLPSNLQKITKMKVG